MTNGITGVEARVYDPVPIPSIWEARTIIAWAQKWIEDCGQLHAAMLFDHMGVEKPNDDDHRFGWTDTKDFFIAPKDGKDCIHLPPAQRLDPANYRNSELTVDVVNHPQHYKTKNGMEAIDVIEAFTDGLEGGEATNTGNVLKYMLRWNKKNGLEDLKKARWYLNRLIDMIEAKDE